MAKTLGDILDDWRQHISQTDTTNTNFSDAQGTIWANDAYRAIVAKLRHLPIKERDYSLSTYTASAPITLNSNTVTIDRVLLKDPTDSKYKQLAIKSLDALINTDPDYAAATSGMPYWLVRKGTFTAVLYVPPSAAVMAQTTPLRTYGLELPTELSADGDTPDLPGNLHDIIAHWMAYRSFSALQDQVKATEHLTLWNSRLKDNKAVSTEFSGQLNRWTWGDSVDNAEAWLR